MKRILITGAAGFLGSHLCDRFIKEGYFVIGMDNLITGDLKNIEHLFKEKNFCFKRREQKRKTTMKSRNFHTFHCCLKKN